MKKGLYLVIMIFSASFIVIVTGLTLLNKNGKLEKIDEDKLNYSDKNFAQEFNKYSYNAEIVYYKESSTNSKANYSVVKYTYKDNIEKFDDYQNRTYEFDDFTNKKQYFRTGSKEDKDAYSIKNITYHSYHSMIVDVLSNSKYSDQNIYVLKTPSDVVKRFIESFNERTQSSITYKEGEKHKIYLSVKNDRIEEFVFLDGDKRISIIFSNINKIEDITLPVIKEAS